MRTFWIGVLILVVATVLVFVTTGSESTPAGSVERAETAAVAPALPSRDRSERPQIPAPDPESEPETAPAEITPIEPSGDSPVTAESAERVGGLNPPSAMPYPDEGGKKSGGPGAPVSPGVPAGDLEPRVEQAGGGAGGSGLTPPDSVVEAEEAEPAQPESQEPGSQEPETREPAVGEDLAEPVVESPAAQEPIYPEPEPKPEPKPEPLPAPAPAAAPGRTPVVETREGLVLDGRWTVPGKGTGESPYRLSWEMLVAVQREYEPRLGKDIVPAWVSALDGKRVSIEGYSLLPVGTTTMNELLVMLNQWDGCCIGVPPTPYDAVEVRLAKRLPSSAAQMFAQGGAIAYGRVTGTFEIDPYIAQGWLLGLYLINDAEAELFGPAGAP